jgi:hypothetical protein
LSTTAGWNSAYAQACFGNSLDGLSNQINTNDILYAGIAGRELSAGVACDK